MTACPYHYLHHNPQRKHDLSNPRPPNKISESTIIYTTPISKKEKPAFRTLTSESGLILLINSRHLLLLLLLCIPNSYYVIQKKLTFGLHCTVIQTYTSHTNVLFSAHRISKRHRCMYSTQIKIKTNPDPLCCHHTW